jgi:SPP1 family phage portal protein
MITYQDFIEATDRIGFITSAIGKHRTSDEYKIAVAAEEYDRQRNVTINNVVKKIYNGAGMAINDPTASNNRIASNFFHRLLTQRVTYSLGNGVTFTQNKRNDADAEGNAVTIDATREKLGDDFDTDMFHIAYEGEKAGKSYALLNYDSRDGYTLHLFKLTEFVPLLDEYDGTLRAGIRFWSLDWNNKPVTAVLYEEDGYTVYRTREKSKGLDLIEYEPKKKYKVIVNSTEAEGDEIIGDENYAAGLPIIPFYGKGKQSALVGMQAAIDSYDMIQSGLANDLTDCAQVYWMIGNALGMDDNDIAQFRERLIYQHIGIADLENSTVTPYTQEIPYNARDAYLTRIEKSIYRDFGAFKVEDVAAGAVTATQIQAAYQAMDEEADDFEYRCIEFIRRLLALIGIEDVPTFKRNRISNQLEQVQMVMQEAQYLDDETVLNLFPNVTPDMIPQILARKDAQDAARWTDDGMGQVTQANNGGYRYEE